jgi:hypothetical protein
MMMLNIEIPVWIFILRKVLVKCICSGNMRYLFIFLILVSCSVQAQIEIDASSVDTTTQFDRYIDYSDKLLVKVMSVAKSNELEIVNKNNKSSIMLKPYGISSLGFGFNYKWLGLGIAFGLPATPEEEKKYGKTQRFDFQVNVYSKKIVIDAFAQHYTGFYVENASDLIDWEETYFPKRKAMQTFSMGLDAAYIFNHENFSYKAAYVRNAVQTKSAGSFLLGGFYNIDHGTSGSDTSSFVPNFFPEEIQDSLPLNAYTARSSGVTFGYTYTVVFLKRFFINLSLIPGVGVKSLTVVKSNKEFNEISGVGRFSARFALGYENKYFLMGITTTAITGDFQFEDYSIKPTTSNAKFFIAKRFNIKKKKKSIKE